MFDLYFLHKSVVNEPNETTNIFFLFNFKSENKATNSRSFDFVQRPQ